MPRKSRLYIPDVPCHIIQCGNNRDACFFSTKDYRFYLECLVDAERYLLACYRYIELNPVTAGMVAHPGEYRWCSYRTNA